MARLKVSKLRYISPFFDQLSESSQLLWWFKSTWQKSIITRKPLHKLFKLFKSFNVCNVFKVFKTSWSKCSSGVGSGFEWCSSGVEWCWKWSPPVDYTAALSLPWGCRSSAEAETYSLASSNHDHIHWLFQINIIIMIVTWKTVMSSWNSSIVLARFCSSINLENFGMRTYNCRSSKKEKMQELKKGIIAGGWKRNHCRSSKIAIAE